METVEAMPMETEMVMDMDAGFRRRRLAARKLAVRKLVARKLSASGKEGAVLYAAVIKSSKGAKFAVELKYSDPLAVRNAKVDFTLSGKNGFKANMGVALPKTHGSGAAARTSAMFANIICYLFGFNMLLTVVFWTYGWSLYNTVQLLATITFLGTPMAPNVEQVMMGLWNLINLNSIFQVKVFGRAPVSELAVYLNTYGSALTLVLIPAAIVFTLFAYMVIKALSKVENELVNKIAETLHRAIVFRFIIRAVLATFVQISIMAFTGFYKSSSIASTMPTLQFASCAVIVLCFATLLFTLLTPRAVIESVEFKMYFGALYDGIKTNVGRAEVAYTAIFLIRRALFVLALLQEDFIVKFACISALTMLQLCYLLSVRPHSDKATHYMEVFNELILLGAIYFLPLFTDMVADGKIRAQMGWNFSIMLLVPLFGVNLVYVFYMGIRRTCEEMRNTCSKKKKAVVVVVADEIFVDDADKFGIDSERKALNKQNKLDVVIEELPDAEELEAEIEK